MSLMRALMNEKDTIEVRINKQFYDGVSSKFIIKNSLGEIEVLKLKCKLETKTECIYFFIHENIKLVKNTRFWMTIIMEQF